MSSLAIGTRERMAVLGRSVIHSVHRSKSSSFDVGVVMSCGWHDRSALCSTIFSMQATHSPRTFRRLASETQDFGVFCVPEKNAQRV